MTIRTIDCKDILNLSTGMLSPLIAILTAYIAWQQWKTNQSRELRESRQSKLVVYRRVKLLLRHALYSPTLDQKLYADFCDACAEADFLFKDDLRRWLDELLNVAAQSMGIQETLQNPARDADLNSVSVLHRELDELTEKLRAANAVLRDQFAGYLN